MRSYFIDVEGHIVRPRSINRLRRRALSKPKETGSRRYPFKVPSPSVARERAKFIGEDICVDIAGQVYRVGHKDGSLFFLYEKR